MDDDVELLKAVETGIQGVQFLHVVEVAVAIRVHQQLAVHADAVLHEVVCQVLLRKTSWLVHCLLEIQIVCSSAIDKEPPPWLFSLCSLRKTTSCAHWRALLLP